MKSDFNVVDFNSYSPLKQYQLLSKVRDQLKSIQKMSWNISQMDKKFPLEQVKEEQYNDLLQIYSDVALELVNINDQLSELVVPNLPNKPVTP